MKILGIIPARGGSKSIPKKNIKKLRGKPLIAWTIETALASKLDRVIVSTDDPEIARIAKKYGAEVPFLRPAELSGDKIGIEPVLKHAYDWLRQHDNYQPAGIAFLPPTSPLRETWHIDEAITVFKNKKADSVVSVHEAIANNNPHWMLKRRPSGKVTLFTDEPLKKIKNRRQELPTCYIRNDVIYILKPKNLNDRPSRLYGKKVELYLMDDYYDADINTPEDWQLCLFKLQHRPSHFPQR